MSKSDINLSKYVGYIFFHQKEDSKEVEVVRLIKIDDFNNKVTIKNIETGKKRTMLYELLKGWTPLEPTGFISFAIVSSNTSTGKVDDVIVSLYRMIDIKLDINEPYAICRQGVNDFFYDIIKNSNMNMVGVSCSKENCPQGIPYQSLAFCDEVVDFNIVNFYITDTIKDVLECLDTRKYDQTLNNLYVDHMKSKFALYNEAIDTKPSDCGWCRKLTTLLEDNNFILDMDTLRNIYSIDTDVSEHLDVQTTAADVEISYVDEDLKVFLSNIFRLAIKDAIAIEFDFDIDLSEFNNTNYTLIRDKNDKTYIISYTIDGEYREEELKEKVESLSNIDKIRLGYINKYGE